MKRYTKKQTGNEGEVTISADSYKTLLECFCKSHPEKAAAQILEMFESLTKLEEEFFINENYSKSGENLNKPENWRKFDFLVCVKGHEKRLVEGDLYKVMQMSEDGHPVITDSEEYVDEWNSSMFRFHSRP